MSQTVPPLGCRKLIYLTKRGLVIGLCMTRLLQVPRQGIGKQENVSKAGCMSSLLDSLLSPKIFCCLFKAEVPQVGLHPRASVIDDWLQATHYLWTWKTHVLPTHSGSLYMGYRASSRCSDNVQTRIEKSLQRRHHTSSF